MSTIIEWKVATYPFVPIGTASAITKKHRNQQLTDYGANLSK